jgi:hypothetical protein
MVSDADAFIPTPGEMDMRFSAFLTLFCLTVMPATPALATDEADVMSRVQRAIDAANGDLNAVPTSNFMPSVVIVDDLAPYLFQGPSADTLADWGRAYAADSEKNDITDFSMTLLKPKRLRVSGDRAYIAVPAVYSFRRRHEPTRMRGTITATLERVDQKWLIATWSWTGM